MKTNIDDATIEAAINEACQETTVPNGYQSLDLRTGYSGWGGEAPARLALARAFLARLPEITLLDGHAEEYECVMKHLDDLGVATKDKDKTLSLVGRISKAVQGAMDVALLPDPPPPVVDGNKPDPYAELKAAYAEGKKIQTQSREDSKWSDWSFPVEPLWNTPPNRYRIKPEPATFEAHGKVWTSYDGGPMPCDGVKMVEWILESELNGNREFEPGWTNLAKNLGNWSGIAGWRYADEPTPEPLDTNPWQPAVGDKVQLKGGSFTMTVEQADSDGIACEWHDSNGVPQARTYTPETLQPA